jgi:hypothetical protein
MTDTGSFFRRAGLFEFIEPNTNRMSVHLTKKKLPLFRYFDNKGSLSAAFPRRIGSAGVAPIPFPQLSLCLRLIPLSAWDFIAFG